MRYATWLNGETEHAGILTADAAGLHPFADAGLHHTTLLDYIQNHSEADMAALAALETVPGIPLDSVTLLAPIPRLPRDVVCVGLNYHDHVEESAHMAVPIAEKAPAAANYFAKHAHCPAGQNACIRAPFALDTRVDYEAEVGVVIGRPARGVSRENALSHVFGLCCFNDLSARDTQHRHGQWFLGKSLDGLTAFGPWIVGIEAFHLPLELAVVCRVNGEERQRSNTRQMIHPIDVMIAELSAGMTLQAGTLIATGTPGGVGAAFSPPRCLAPSDVCEVEIEDVGVLRNTFA